MGRTILKTMKTHRGNYVYDRNTHTVMPVDEESFEELRAYEQGKLDEEHCHALQNFRSMGILEENVVKEIRHPDTDFLEHYADCRVRQVVLQVTQQCNLRCAYCAYSGNYFTREHCDKKMTFETAKKAIDFGIQHSNETEEMCFSFYGGEPLLEIGLIRQCVSYIKEQMGQRKYKYTMTTNGTLLTPATVEFLSDNNFSIFISLDGPKEEHDVNRKFRTGKGSFDTIMKNISHIKEHNYEFWKNLGFMITLNPKVDLKKVTEFFDHTDILPHQLIQYHEIEETNLKNKDWIHYQETYALNRRYMYLKVLMCLAGMLEKDKIHQMFGATLTMKQKFFEGLKHGQYMKKTVHHGGPCIPGIRKIFVSVDGTFYPCEKVVENAIEFSIGNIRDGLTVSKMEPLLNLGRLTEKQCITCPALQRCNICIARINGEEEKNFITAENKLEICKESCQEFISELYEYCVINECRIEEAYFTETKQKHQGEFKAENLSYYSMEKLEVPVLAILGQGEQCSKTDTLIKTCKSIQKKGYRVLGIGSNSEKQDEMIKKLPDFFLDAKEGFEKKVVNLNKFVKELCDREEPEIIVIEIPGGISPVSEKEHFHFGELLNVVSCALEVDAAIFNLYYNVCQMDEKSRKEYLNFVQEHCMGRFQFPIDFFCVSSNYMKLDLETKQADYLYLKKNSSILKNTNTTDDMVYLWENNLELEKKINQLLLRLENNTEVI